VEKAVGGCLERPGNKGILSGRESVRSGGMVKAKEKSTEKWDDT